MKENTIIYRREKMTDIKRENKSETKPEPTESVPVYVLQQRASCIVLDMVQFGWQVSYTWGNAFIYGCLRFDPIFSSVCIPGVDLPAAAVIVEVDLEGGLIKVNTCNR
jgi:hypothetical protein